MSNPIKCPMCNERTFHEEGFACASCGYEPIEFAVLLREQLKKAEADIDGYQKRAAVAERDLDALEGLLREAATHLMGPKATKADRSMVECIDAALGGTPKPRRKRVNRETYAKLVAEDREWLMAQDRSLERDHIAMILDRAVGYEYGPGAPESEFEQAGVEDWTKVDSSLGDGNCAPEPEPPDDALAVAARWIEDTLGPMCPDESLPHSLAALIAEERQDAERGAVMRCDGLALDAVPGTAVDAARRIRAEFPEYFERGEG